MTGPKVVDLVPAGMKETHEAVVHLTDHFCRTHLTDEYAAVSRTLAATLSRRRPSPLMRGDAKSWACGIVYALGRVNFLFDPTGTPHMRQRDLVRLFGIGAATAYARARLIWSLLEMIPFDPRYTLPSRLEGNPLVWTVELDGFLVDVRHLPRPLQEEAYRRGLIPYLPETGRRDR